jgi:hypothetical protein
MEKEFVPYELALRMKQLGFDGSCFAIWSGFDEQNFSITDTIRLYSSGFRINGTQSSKFYINDFNSLRVAAPTYSQAFRWFREKYDLLHSIIEYNKDGSLIIEISQNKIEIFRKMTYFNITEYEEAELECLKKLIEIVENIK